MTMIYNEREDYEREGQEYFQIKKTRGVVKISLSQWTKTHRFGSDMNIVFT